MKVPVQKTPRRAISPMVFINWVFGIGIIEIPIGVPRPLISIFWSIINFLIYLALLKMADVTNIVTFHRSVIAAGNYRTIAYLYTAFIAISMCLSHITTKIGKASRHKLYLINNRLKTLGVPNDYEVIFKAQIIHVSAVFVFIIVLSILDFKYIGFDLPSDSSRVGLLMVSHYLLVFTFIVDGNFTLSARYLSNRFQHLNKLLAESGPVEGIKTMVISESDDLQFQRYSSVIKEIHQNNSLTLRAAEKQWLLYIIRETRIMHREICKVVKELERAYGVQVLFSMALSFGLITALFYTWYIITTTSSASSFVLDNWIPKIIILIWIAFYAMKILLIVDACHNTTHEANRTAELINNLLNTAICDEDIRDEIDIFSLQLLQNPLRCTASGFLTLDYSLVHGIIGSVTKYLVILIQMRSIYEPKNIISAPNSTMLVQPNGTD